MDALPATKGIGRAVSQAPRALLMLSLLIGAIRVWGAVPVGTAAVPLLQPTSVAYDAAGNLYFAESQNNVVRRLAPDGSLTTVAGSSLQGFSGDGGDALAAALDTPRGVTLDAVGNLYIADTHNNRIRRVDAQTHVITTMAGTGAAGYSGDGGAATSAQLRLPLALALDGAQHLLLADSGNHRVRSIELGSGVISTVAGDGRQGFAGDGGPATEASFDSPSGLVLDPSGDLFIADAGNRRVREVSAATRQVVTVAGATGSAVPLSRPEGLTLNTRGGLLISDAGNQCVYLLDLATGRLSIIAGKRVQAFGGDNGLATLAMLNTPTDVAIAPDGDLAIADSGNSRIRLVSTAADGTISTVAGKGSKVPVTLAVSGGVAQQYGSASMSVRLSGAAVAEGSVSLRVNAAAGESQVFSGALLAGVATFDLHLLPAGGYQLLARWAGDGSSSAATSEAVALTIQPLPLHAGVSSWTMVYGCAPPAFGGSLSGVLPQDQGRVSLEVALPPAPSLTPGVYPLVVSLSGAAAANYALAGGEGQLTVTKAPVQLLMSEADGGLLLSTKSTTSGVPGGAVTLLNAAGGSVGSVPLDAAGSATLSTASLAPGAYTLFAVYSGDADFFPAQSAPQTIQIGVTTAPAQASDFVLSSVGSGVVSAPAGGTAAFPLQVRPTGDALASPILLTVAGLPLGATASFSPGLIPPGGGASVATLTVQLPRTTTADLRGERSTTLVALGMLSPLLLTPWARRRLRSLPLLLSLLAVAGPVILAGCGDRVASTPTGSAAPHIYPLVVTATTTLGSGSALQHTASVTLTVP